MKDVRNLPSTSVGLGENAPEALRELPIVGGVNMILAETNCVGNLVGQLIDADLYAKLREGAHEIRVEIGDGARAELDCPLTAIAGRDKQHVVQEVEIELEAAILEGNWGRGQAPRRHIEHDMPRVVEPRRLHEADLAHDLSPQLQSGAGIFPRVDRAVPARHSMTTWDTPAYGARHSRT